MINYDYDYDIWFLLIAVFLQVACNCWSSIYENLTDWMTASRSDQIAPGAGGGVGAGVGGGGGAAYLMHSFEACSLHWWLDDRTFWRLNMVPTVKFRSQLLTFFRWQTWAKHEVWQPDLSWNFCLCWIGVLPIWKCSLVFFRCHFGVKLETQTKGFLFPSFTSALKRW